LESEASLALQREQVKAQVDIARAKVASQRIAAQAASHRAELARETRGFFEKSFALGQTDLPTRLRYENEAAEAEREAALAVIDLSAAISALRQAQGLLP
jgi:cobalt-zinc-cadmium efflux system outer membrane protein